MKEVVILGAGYAGLKALHKLQHAHKELHITLVDQNDFHCEKISLAEVAAGSLTRDDICYNLQDIINPKVTTFIQAKVQKIDPKHKVILLDTGQKLEYDYAIVALGFVSETFGIPGAKEYALHMTNIEEAEKIHTHLLSEFAAYQNDHNQNHLNIIVCGAGFTGVELLGDLLDQRDNVYTKQFGITADQFNIICINGSDDYLPMFPKKLADYGIDTLKKRGVNFLIGHVSGIKENLVEYKDADGNIQTVAGNNILWTTGVSGSPVIQESGFEEHRNRVRNNPDLTFGEYPDLYFTGDVAAVFPDGAKRPYPTTAQIALQMGHVSAENILRQIEGKPTETFQYRNLGTVASLGNCNAFGTPLGMKLHGYLASVTKKMIDDLSLYETGGLQELLACGKFDFYH